MFLASSSLGDIEKLCIDLADMASRRSGRPIFVEGAELRIPTAIAIQLGFIASELITNSLKYAKGRILIGLQRTFGHCVLSISDVAQVAARFRSGRDLWIGYEADRSMGETNRWRIGTCKGGGGQGTRFAVRM
jgi:hypothetical protein